jgi:hypothetical protein
MRRGSRTQGRSGSVGGRSQRSRLSEDLQWKEMGGSKEGRIKFEQSDGGAINE